VPSTGISEAPQRRFDQHLDKNSTWEEQVVLVEAANSSTTASLEITLLALLDSVGIARTPPVEESVGQAAPLTMSTC
jgi:hypothetical protein